MGSINFVIVPETTALIIGKKFGKTNFSYFISPKKTVEGLIGQYLGVFISIGINELHYLFLPSHLVPIKFSIALQFFGGLVAITTAVLSDLIESILKRGTKVKDSSSIKELSKGLGGFMDKFDSLGPTLVTFYCIAIVSGVIQH